MNLKDRIERPILCGVASTMVLNWNLNDRAERNLGRSGVAVQTPL